MNLGAEIQKADPLGTGRHRHQPIQPLARRFELVRKQVRAGQRELGGRQPGREGQCRLCVGAGRNGVAIARRDIGEPRMRRRVIRGCRPGSQKGRARRFEIGGPIGKGRSVEMGRGERRIEEAGDVEDGGGQFLMPGARKPSAIGGKNARTVAAPRLPEAIGRELVEGLVEEEAVRHALLQQSGGGCEQLVAWQAVGPTGKGEEGLGRGRGFRPWT
ncbi:MAG: hypothetical protein ACK4Z0_07730 [Sphingomonadaceae bacterium]